MIPPERIVTFTVMPPKKATVAQKAKSVAAGETSQAQRTTRARAHIIPEILPQAEGSSTPPDPEGITAAVDRGTASPPASETPAPEPPAPQPGA